MVPSQFIRMVLVKRDHRPEGLQIDLGTRVYMSTVLILNQIEQRNEYSQYVRAAACQ